MSEAELRAESTYHDRIRAAIAAMRRSAVDLVDDFHADFLEGKQNRFAHDGGPDHNLGRAMADYRVHRLENLADRGLPQFFGRMWLDSGEDYHLGRHHVRDEDYGSVPLVVDWRAEIARRYYQASVHDRIEVAKRRRFGFAGSTLTSLEDEDLRSGQEPTSDLLTAEVERPRTGPMRDIVATIQPEQDELIRRDADTTLCVQGAPGTGKTAVGLHRAAWLLYTYPRRFAGHGMLVVGPNDSFLRYIAGVLPTLGEASVRQTTVDQLIGAVDARASEPDRVAILKHDARMAEVCKRAVWRHLQRPRDAVTVEHGGSRFTLPADQVLDVVRAARHRSHSWEGGRVSVEHALVDALTRQYEQRWLRAVEDRWQTELKRRPSFKQALDALWPRLTAKQVLRRLYADADFRASVCAGLLTDEESNLISRGSGPLKPTAADMVLLDEVQAVLRPLEPTQSVAHIVVDEAQDLSPMQCRAISRHSANGSLTVLGDLAQGTTPWAAADWPTQMGHLGRPDAEYTELTIGYRVPGVIIDLANRVLPHLGVPVAPARSLRTDGSVEVMTVHDVIAGTADAVEKALVAEGMVGVIAPDALLDELRRALPVDERVELVPGGLAKGLEFDHVVVVEPALFTSTTPADAEPDIRTGLRRLYVALTRAVSGLTIVTTQPLPPEMG
ncbi:MULTISPECIES: 3'-5' exonuclease [unclassified Blastococcus]|uniref:HelD family protein n=1 Tax=unclassified Blastococcus TaxID=2619396 RepID=UPI001EF11B41|nr:MULTISPECIES: 3'-5' exonuclease [unclassified Blastococcus]